MAKKKKTVAAPAKPKPKTTGFALTQELLDALDARATAEGIKRGRLVSQILHEAMGLEFVYEKPGRRWPAKGAE
jgi:predicted DNA binding CopG/RHH family protein